jgi:ribosomal protein S18 acetylase RimI-like enzyme
LELEIVTHELHLDRYDNDTVDAIYHAMVRLYADTHEQLAGNPFYRPDHFEASFVKQRAHDGFELVAAQVDGHLVGVAFGFVEIPDVQYGICEIMVTPDYQRRGIAKRLHDELLRSRPEQRADLYVRKDNVAAQAAYRRWGWTKIGDVQPSPDAPDFDEMILALPVTSGDTADRLASTMDVSVQFDR